MKITAVDLFMMFVLCLMAIMILLPSPSSHAQNQKHWQMQTCDTLDCVTDFLNKLPVQDALEAKVIVINSQRSLLGVLSNPYYIYYRR